MFTVKIAELNIAIDNKYPFTETLCEKYKTEGCGYDICVSASQNEINEERAASECNFSDGYLESVCIYRNIAKALPEFNAFVMHAAALKYGDRAFCFAAESGTGKTTHAILWKQLLGENVLFINGDKPIIRFTNGIPRVFGTPWAGKENLNENISSQLGGICFISQSESNAISKMHQHEALNRLLKQIYIPSENILLDRTLDMIAAILDSIPIWELSCNISAEAAKLSFGTMTGKDNK